MSCSRMLTPFAPRILFRGLSFSLLSFARHYTLGYDLKLISQGLHRLPYYKMASSCVVYPNETFVCSYVPQVPAPGLETLIHVFRSPLWVYYAQEGIKNLSEGYGNAYLYAALRYVVAPAFFAYLWNPKQPKVNIFISDAAPVILREGEPEPEDGLDSTSKQILSQLRANPNGLTAKKLFRALKVYDEDLEEFDLNGRLYLLQRMNLVWQGAGVHTAVRWVA